MSLPNGDKQLVSKKGDVLVSPSITLSDVYFIESFSVNLLSFSKLTQGDSYNVQFSKNYTFIYDKVQIKVVGQSEVFEGLYLLPQISGNSCFAGAISTNT